LGWAIVYLTIILRLTLLPFTIIAEKNKARNLILMQEVKKLEKDFHNDPILQKEEIRRIFKQKKIKPWAKTFELSVQVLVLILLYQVFMGGITGEKLVRTLYHWIEFPGRININFYGNNLGETHNILWAGLVALFLLIEIYVEYKNRKLKLERPDLFYFFIFPLFTFLLLMILPMVKSLFILTSLLISMLLHFFMGAFTKPVVVEETKSKN